MKILTVVGARPQFVKAAMVSRALLENAPQIDESIIHTGQHYDENLSQVFFDQMQIPRPVANLQIGSGGHGEVTGRMLEAIEREILGRRPDRMMVYGDTNSTLAGALAATKLRVPVAHVEAGLRSFNRAMPEEVNRVLTDHVSDLLLCSTSASIENLKREGITEGVHQVGDVMFDAALAFGELAATQSTIMTDLALAPKGFSLATVHRAENTDDPARLKGILRGLGGVAEDGPVVFPVHPRTRHAIESLGLGHFLDKLLAVEPVSFFDMVCLEKEARLILTDSGGVQKEAYFHGVRCVTMRDETEWVETVEMGWNTLVGASEEAILDAAAKTGTGKPIDEYGAGDASGEIAKILTNA